MAILFTLRLFASFRNLLSESRRRNISFHIFILMSDLVFEKIYVRYSVQCKLSMICAHDPTVCCMSYSTPWTLCSVVTSSVCNGSAMLFECSKMLWRNGYLMRESKKVGKEDDLVCIEEVLSSIGVTSCRRRLNKVVLFADFLRSPHQITGTSYCIRTTWPSQCSERSVKADRNTLIRLLMAN